MTFLLLTRLVDVAQAHVSVLPLVRPRYVHHVARRGDCVHVDVPEDRVHLFPSLGLPRGGRKNNLVILLPVGLCQSRPDECVFVREERRSGACFFCFGTG